MIGATRLRRRQDYDSHAMRDLQRGQATGLPSGEAVKEAEVRADGQRLGPVGGDVVS